MKLDFMRLAIDEARKSLLLNEIPIGCVIVDKGGNVISAMHNDRDACAHTVNHAEILCIQNACLSSGLKRLDGCSMYVTLEPCAMCAYAISLARIERLYIGALSEKTGAVVSNIEIFSESICSHRPEVYSGIHEQECSELLKEFFLTRRKND